MLLGYRGAVSAAPRVYTCGCRDASAAMVVTPVPAREAGMFGFSSPECSPVTSAAGV